MRKLISIFICFCIILSFSGCKKSKFDTLDSLSNHLKGIWYDDGEYYIFEDCGKIYKVTYGQINGYLTNYFNSVISEFGTEKFETLTIRECLDGIYDDVFSSPISSNTKYRVYYEQGKIVFNEGKTNEYSLVVLDDNLQYIDGDEIDGEYVKISDAIELTENLFGEYVSEAKQDYKIPSDIFLPSPSEYLAKLKNIHPEINNWILTDSKSNMYTDNGSYNNNNSFLMYDDDSLTFSKNNGSLLIINNADYIMISAKKYSTLEELLKYVEFKIAEYPGSLKTKEIIDLFNSNGVISRGTLSLNTTIDGIQYCLLRNIDGKITSIQIKIK